MNWHKLAIPTRRDKEEIRKVLDRMGRQDTVGAGIRGESTARHP